MQNYFVDPNDFEKIEIDKEIWIKIQQKISYADSELMSGEENAYEKGKKILLRFIKEWNLVDKDGKIAEITEANISKLEMSVANKILSKVSEKIINKIGLDKKKE